MESASGEGTSIYVRYSPSTSDVEQTLEKEPGSESGTKHA
jgi:hypothetical protein